MTLFASSAAAVLALAACGPAAVSPPDAGPAAAPQIQSFTVSPAQLASPGGQVTLHWEASGATAIAIDQGVGAVSGASGDKAAAVTQTTTFTLTATNAAGSSTKAATVTVLPAPAPAIAAFTATPSSLPAGGGAVALAWSVTNATALQLNGSDTTGTSGKSVNVLATTTFHLVATGPGGTASKDAIVTVAPAAPAIGSFTATPATLSAPGSVLLAWTTSGSVTSLSIDQGVGDVTGTTSKSASVAASTTFTLTATGPGGTASQSLLVTVTATDYWVDPVAGLDTNPGTQALPFKRITKAMSVATSGNTVWLLDGTFDAVNEGCATNTGGCLGLLVTMPAGVTLRALHPRLATVSFLTLRLASGSGSFLDLALSGVGTSLQALSTAAGSTLTLSGVSFNQATLLLKGAIKAAMTPGTFAGTHTASPAGFASLTDSTELVLQGATIDGAGAGTASFGGGMITANTSTKLTLDGVTIKNWKAAGIAAGTNLGTPIVVALRNGTKLDNVGVVENCAAGAAVILSGKATLTMDSASIVNSTNAALCVRTGTTATVSIGNGSSLSGNLRGILDEPGGTNIDLTLTVDGSHLDSNSSSGLQWNNRGTFTFSNTSFTGNGVGLDLREGGAGASPAYKVRGCTFTGSATYGIAVRSFTVAGSTTVDLGTGADPGGNTLTGNGTTSLFLDPPGALTVPAHGNTWNANNEGADGAGQYPAGAVNGPQNGTNFQTPAGTTLAL